MAVYGELGRFPLFVKATKQTIKYYNRCLQSDQNSLIYDAFIEQKNNMHENSWLYYIKFMSESMGVTFNFSEINHELIFSKLKGKFIEYWKEKLFNNVRHQGYGNKLRTYRKFKMMFAPEAYLSIIPSFEVRKELCKFRVSNHKLKIETGRHNNVPLKNRLCNECNVIEDEEHFLINCRIFIEKRETLYNTVTKTCCNFNNLSSENKMIYLLTCEDEETVKDVGNFIKECIIR